MNYYLGIDLGGTEAKIGIIERSGSVLLQESYRTESELGGIEMVRRIGDRALLLMKKAQAAYGTIEGAGVGLPGFVDSAAGLMRQCINIPQLTGLFIGPELSRILGIPVNIDNDVNAMAIGELLYGNAQGFKDIICLTIGTGVGGAVILDGKLHRGVTNTAGEVGHLIIDAEGIPCPCGGKGCLERYIGRDGILALFRRQIEQGKSSVLSSQSINGTITPKLIYEAAVAGDSVSLEVLAETGRILGIGLTSLTNILNPEIIVIGGGISHAGDFILDPARKELLKRAYSIPAQKVRVVRAKLQNNAGIIGAASLAIR